MTVFISSDSKEFQSIRLILKECLLQICMNPIIYEDYGAEDIEMPAANENDIRDCHLFLGIYGSQYSEPTEKELDWAIENRKSLLFYFKKLENGETVDARMKLFIEKIKALRKIHRQFTDILDLKKNVLEDVLSESVKGFIFLKYEFPIGRERYIGEVIRLSDEFELYEQFLSSSANDCKIIKIDDIDGNLKYIINMGIENGIFEDLEFEMEFNEGKKIKFRIENALEKMSICARIDNINLSPSDDIEIKTKFLEKELIFKKVDKITYIHQRIGRFQI